MAFENVRPKRESSLVSLLSVNEDYETHSMETFSPTSLRERYVCTMLCVPRKYLLVFFTWAMIFVKHFEWIIFCCTFHSWKSVVDYVDQQFQQYYQDETGLNRRNIVDNRVHCCLYFISPYGHGSVNYVHIDYIFCMFMCVSLHVMVQK